MLGDNDGAVVVVVVDAKFDCNWVVVVVVAIGLSANCNQQLLLLLGVFITGVCVRLILFVTCLDVGGKSGDNIGSGE